MSETNFRKKTKLSQFDTDKSIIPLARYLRLIQFLNTLVLFSLAIYMTSMPTRHITDISCILLICLSSSHLFFQSLDIMTFFSGYNVPESPMYIFSLIGMILFAIAGILFIYYIIGHAILWTVLVSMILCFVISVLYTIEVIAVLLYWKRKYSSLKKCHPLMMETLIPTTQTLLAKVCELPSSHTNVCKCEVTTSVSGQDLVIPINDTQHEMRKISMARRREYVDSPSSVPALSIMAIAEIQTDDEITQAERRETIGQAVNEHELYQQKRAAIPTFKYATRSPHESQSLELIAQPAPPPHSIANTPQSLKNTSPTKTLSGAQYYETSRSQYQNTCPGCCPAPVVIVRGGMVASCCGSCDCCVIHPENYPAFQCVHRMSLDKFHQQRKETSAIHKNDANDSEPLQQI